MVRWERINISFFNIMVLFVWLLRYSQYYLIIAVIECLIRYIKIQGRFFVEKTLDERKEHTLLWWQRCLCRTKSKGLCRNVGKYIAAKATKYEIRINLCKVEIFPKINKRCEYSVKADINGTPLNLNLLKMCINAYVLSKKVYI